MSLRHIIMAASQYASLTTVRFETSQTWTCPSGVALLASVAGKGSAGTSDYDSPFTSNFYANQAGTQSGTPYADWSTVYGWAVADRGTYAAAVGTLFTGTTSFLHRIMVDSSNRWVEEDYTYSWTNLYIVSVTALSTINGGGPTSGNILYADLGIYKGWTFETVLKAPGSPGSDSTGFSKTFPGGDYTGTYPSGVGGAAALTTFTNVAVTAGVGYPIVVASGGYVEITYQA